jgi:SAM-dependent methyltransferase
LWYTCLSSLIVARSSVANARDIVHSRHRFKKHDQVPNTLDRFCKKLHLIERQMSSYVALREEHPHLPGPAEVHRGDARHAPVRSASSDLVITSPPYGTALDYIRAHRFSVAWLSDVLQIGLDEYVRLGGDYIGSERKRRLESLQSFGVPEVDELVERVSAVDPRKGRLANTYFHDMHAVLNEIGRVLRPGGHAVLVVCPSTIAHAHIPWHEAFLAMAARFPKVRRLLEVEVIPRRIDEHRRVLPYKKTGQLSNRMSVEFVVVLQKATLKHESV